MSDGAADAGGRYVPAPGEDISRALALVNTRRMDAGKQVDLIADVPRAADWLIGHGLLPRGSTVDDQDAGRLPALREAIRALFAARMEQRTPAADAVSFFNAALASAPPIPALIWDSTGPRQGEQPPAPGINPVSAALALLAKDALDVLTATGGPEPAPCGAHGCIRWFLRTHAARQWCSDRCGDRVRAARHYARHHEARGLRQDGRTLTRGEFSARSGSGMRRCGSRPQRPYARCGARR